MLKALFQEAWRGENEMIKLENTEVTGWEAAICLNLPDRVYNTSQETGTINVSTQDTPKPLSGLVYKEYDGEIVNIGDTATIYVTVPDAEDNDEIVVVVVNCNTGQRIEQKYTENLLFENIEYGTYAVAAYRIEEDKHTEVDVTVEISCDVKEKSNVIPLMNCYNLYSK